MAWIHKRNDLITRSFRLVGAIKEGGTPSSSQMQEGSDLLNILINDLQKDGALRWKRDERHYALTASSEVTVSGTNYRCIKPHTSSATNKPGTVLGKAYWVADGTSGSAWVTATAYTAIGILTLDTDILDIEKVFYRQDELDQSIELIGREDWNNISNKGSTGSPSKAYFDKTGDSANVLRLYQQPNSATEYMITVQVIVPITEAETNVTLDFTEPWYRALFWTLASELAPIYGLPLDEVAFITRKADKLRIKRLATNDDVDDLDFIKPYC